MNGNTGMFRQIQKATIRMTSRRIQRTPSVRMGGRGRPATHRAERGHTDDSHNWKNNESEDVGVDRLTEFTIEREMNRSTSAATGAVRATDPVANALRIPTVRRWPRGRDHINRDTESSGSERHERSAHRHPRGNRTHGPPPPAPAPPAAAAAIT